MRKLLPLSFAAALAITPAFAASSDDTSPSPLPAGQAAGTNQAGMLGSSTFWLISAGVVAAAIAIPLTSGNHSSSTTTTTHH